MKKIKPRTFLLNTLGVILALIIVFPIYIMVISSLKPDINIFDMKVFPNPADLTLNNYVEVFQSQNFAHYIGNSFFVAIIVTVCALFFHSMAGYSLARLNFPGRNAIFTWILSTLMVPFSVIMIPLFIIIKNMGLVNSLWGVIIPMIPHAYGIFLFRQFYLNIPRELEESAQIDGSSYFGTFLRIVMPLSKPISITMAVSFFLANWNNYLWPLIVAQKRENWMIQIAIASFKTEKTVQWNMIMAASCIAALPTIILFFIFQRYIADGIKTSGIKG